MNSILNCSSRLKSLALAISYSLINQILSTFQPSDLDSLSHLSRPPPSRLKLLEVDGFNHAEPVATRARLRWRTVALVLGSTIAGCLE